MDIKAIEYATEAHARVNHLYNGKPYSVHLFLVVAYAMKYIDCIPKEIRHNVISACWLHDTIEDCRLTYNDIKDGFGQEVALLVYAVTNEKGKNRKERASDKYYADMLEIPYARFVKLCDRLANIEYSDSSLSPIYNKYGKEHEAFLKSLFPDGNYAELKPLVEESKKLLRYTTI